MHRNPSTRTSAPQRRGVRCGCSAGRSAVRRTRRFRKSRSGGARAPRDSHLGRVPSHRSQLPLQDELAVPRCARCREMGRAAQDRAGTAPPASMEEAVVTAGWICKPCTATGRARRRRHGDRLRPRRHRCRAGRFTFPARTSNTGCALRTTSVPLKTRLTGSVMSSPCRSSPPVRAPQVVQPFAGGRLLRRHAPDPRLRDADGRGDRRVRASRDSPRVGLVGGPRSALFVGISVVPRP